MAAAFLQNLVVCPHCGEDFNHDRINGLALIEAVSHIESRKRMYCRLTLDTLERAAEENLLTFPLIKKAVLDNFNDFARDIHTIIGLGSDSE